jgi:Tfp pilus tip-associated adhesin PilY1
MIDIETGEAIYKHALMGAGASEPAAVDTNFDGYLDTIYIGTTLGVLYRANIGPFDHDGDPTTAPHFPLIESLMITETSVDGTDVTREVDRIVDTDFGPQVLLFTSDPIAIPPQVRPIFFRPSIAYLPEFNRYAVAVGTGHREDIFRRDQPTGRFFVFVDNVSNVDIMDPGFTPFSPVSAALTPIDPDDPDRLESTSLLKPGEGWWMELDANERVVTEPFALSGILFFSTFIPDPGGPEVIPENSLCREKGVSNIYGVFTTNADGLLSDDEDVNNPDDLVRYVTGSGLVSSPCTEQSQTKYPPPGEDGDVVGVRCARRGCRRERR